MSMAFNSVGSLRCNIFKDIFVLSLEARFHSTILVNACWVYIQLVSVKIDLL